MLALGRLWLAVICQDQSRIPVARQNLRPTSLCPTSRWLKVLRLAKRVLSFTRPLLAFLPCLDCPAPSEPSSSFLSSIVPVVVPFPRLLSPLPSPLTPAFSTQSPHSWGSWVQHRGVESHLEVSTGCYICTQTDWDPTPCQRQKISGLA